MLQAIDTAVRTSKSNKTNKDIIDMKMAIKIILIFYDDTTYYFFLF